MMENNFKSQTDYFKNGDLIKGKTIGSSMLPLFRDGKDIVTVKKIADKPRVNDVLLYRNLTANGLVLHRLIKITDNGFVIRGDNCFANETDVKYEDIIGVMAGFERNGKYFDCKKSLAYKLYIIYIRLSYPVRKLAVKAKSFLIRVKNRLLK